jgi:membrane protein
VARAERLVLRLIAHNAFEAAASVAFWFFLSLVPLLVLAGFLVGQVARARGVDDLVGPLLGVVPDSAESLIRSELERLAGARGTTLAPLGTLGFLWTASSGLHNLMDAFETTVKARRRQWWKQRVIALAWLAIGLATACTIAWVVVTVDRGARGSDAVAQTPAAQPAPSQPPGRAAQERGAKPSTPAARPSRPALPRAGVARLRSPRTKLLAATLLLVCGLVLLGGFYRFSVEHPPGIARRVWPGAGAAVASWLAVSWGFGEYVTSMADYALYYGSLAAVATLLIWLYLTSLALVLGMEVNAELEGLR